MKLIEREERRKCELLEFLHFVNEHQSLLQRSLNTCGEEVELGGFMHEYVRQDCMAIAHRVEDTRKELLSTRKTSYIEHSEHFKKQYFVLGDLIYRKERYLEELNKKVDLLNLQQEVAMDSYDDQAKTLALYRGEIEVKVEEVSQLLSTLKEHAEIYVESFKPTAKILSEENHNFVHPLIELKSLNRLRAKKLDQYYATVVMEDRQLRSSSAAKGGNGAGAGGIRVKGTSRNFTVEEIEHEKRQLSLLQDMVTKHKARYYSNSSSSSGAPRKVVKPR